MPRGANQKLKLIYLMKILLEKTDEAHPMTLKQITEELAGYGIAAERKSLYADFEALRVYGLDIICEKRSRSVYYYIGARDFEVAELKLLVDAVQSSRFITEKKSRELIRKLEGFVSSYEGKGLHRQVCVQGRVKTMNESIYYNVDKLHQAIGDNVQIQFQYFQWNVDKEMELRREGEFYRISPWELIWADEKYYLMGYDGQAGMMKHFRVDKMLNIRLLEEMREGRPVFEKMDMASYSQRRFGMFGGSEQTVKLRCENAYAGVIIDRFGKDVNMRKVDGEHFEVNVEVAVSSRFFGWVFALGGGVRIVEPKAVVEQMKEELSKQREIYEEQTE